MIDIFKIGGSIELHGADKANNIIESLAKKGANLATKLGKGLATVAKGVGTAVAAASAGIAAISKASLDAYANYEQLVGGVETLFGAGGQSLAEYAASVGKSVDDAREEYNALISAQDEVLANSQKAFQTAGLSANEYMELATSFSASLLQGLNGDTQAAAKYTDMAIQDMADNANKMGTDMASIQNAYQGFSKQNYTMLDNLKLGYGGTKQEMQRLLKDADAINAKQGKITKYSVDNLADVYEAIHVVQEEMGIYGTTQKEAATTIQGSLSMTKAAWKNLLVGFADGDQDLQKLIDNLVSSVTTAAGNIVPRLVQILGGLSSALERIIPVISAQLPALIEKLLPGIISGAVSLLTGLIQALPTILQILIDQIPFIITQIGAALIAVFPVLLQSIKDLLGQIWDYIAVSLLGTSADFESSFATIQSLFNDLWTVLQTAWDSLGKPIWDNIQACIGIVRDAFAERMPAIREFVSGCFSDIKKFWDNNLKPCFDAIKNFLENVWAPAFQWVFNKIIGPVVDEAFAGIKRLWNNVLKPVFTGITDFLTGIFTLNFKQAFEGIVKIVKGIFGGIVNAIKTPINMVIGVVNNFISGLNKLKVPDWVPLVGGKGINIPLIPKLAEGGILEKGQIGFLEGNGAEAVVPLHNNKKWIKAVAEDMDNATGGASTVVQALLADILAQLQTIAEKDIVLDTGALVGGLADPIDTRLGQIRAQKARAW